MAYLFWREPPGVKGQVPRPETDRNLGLEMAAFRGLTKLHVRIWRWCGCTRKPSSHASRGKMGRGGRFRTIHAQCGDANISTMRAAEVHVTGVFILPEHRAKSRME